MTTVMLPVKTISEANARCHWAAKANRAKRQRHVARALTAAHPLPVVVTITRYSAGTLDDDNLRSALKAVRDGIADRLGVPDNDPRVRWCYAQARCTRGEFGVQVRMEPAEPQR